MSSDPQVLSRSRRLRAALRPTGPNRLAAGAVALAFVAMFASGPGQSFLLAIYVDPLLRNTGLSRTAFSGLYAVATVASALSMVAAGRVADRLGLRVLWGAAALGLAAGCVIAGAAAGALAVLAALILLRACGQGAFPLLGTLLVATRFDRARGKALGVAGLGLTAAAALLPPALAGLISAVGWRAALDVTAAALVVCVLPLALLVPRAAVRTSEHPQHHLGPLLPDRSALVILFALAVPPLVITAIVFHAVSLLGSFELSAAAAASGLSAMAIADALAKLPSGALADRLSTRGLLALMCVALAAAPAILLLASSAAAALAAFVVLGIASALFAIASGLVWARDYPEARMGRLYGLALSVQIAAAALGPLPLAVSVDRSGGYEAGHAALLGLTIAALLALARWRPPARDSGQDG